MWPTGITARCSCKARPPPPLPWQMAKKSRGLTWCSQPTGLGVRASMRRGAHLLVGGGLKLYLKQGLEGAVDPGKSQVQQMVETVLTPAHTNPLEPLLNTPFAGAFDHPAPQGPSQRLVRLIVDVLAVPLQIRRHRA